jgi:hypothetical protein
MLPPATLIVPVVELLSCNLIMLFADSKKIYSPYDVCAKPLTPGNPIWNGINALDPFTNIQAVKVLVTAPIAVP